MRRLAVCLSLLLTIGLTACQSQPADPSIAASTITPATILTKTPTISPTLTPTPNFRRTPSATPTATATSTIPPIAEGGGGFVDILNLDVSEFPLLPISYPDGIQFEECEQVRDSSQVKLISRVNTFVLCLYDQHIEEGQRFSVALISPTGTTYSQNYTVSSGSAYPDEFSRDEEVYAEYAQISETDQGQIIEINLNFSSDIPGDAWTVTAPGVHSHFEVPVLPKIVALPENHESNPFQFPVTIYESGDVVRILGQGYEPNHQHIIGLYSMNTTQGPIQYGPINALYATEITIGPDGRFEVRFEVGSATPPAMYYVLIDPASKTKILGGFNTFFCISNDFCREY